MRQGDKGSERVVGPDIQVARLEEDDRRPIAARGERRGERIGAQSAVRGRLATTAGVLPSFDDRTSGSGDHALPQQVEVGAPVALAFE